MDCWGSCLDLLGTVRAFGQVAQFYNLQDGPLLIRRQSLPSIDDRFQNGVDLPQFPLDCTGFCSAPEVVMT